MRSLASRLAAVLLVVGLGAHVARADDDGADESFGRSGAYVGVGASRAFNFFETYLDNEPVLSNIDFSDRWGVNARAGYRLASWFALEGEYEWLGDMNATLGSVEVARVGTQTATANFRLIAPFWRVQPYFLGGVGAVFFHTSGPLDLKIDSTALAGRVGLGVDVYLTKSILLNAAAEAMLTNAKTTIGTPLGSVSANGLGLVTLQVGLGYRF